LTLAKMDYRVAKFPLLADVGAAQSVVDSHVATGRADNGQIFGIVGSDYTPVQNSELAEFVDALSAGESGVKLESCGSLRNGARVWFLARAESFAADAAERDVLTPYMAVCNGHDGTLALRVFGTSVRIVCANTLKMAIDKSQADATTLYNRTIHTTGIMDRLPAIKGRVQRFFVGVESFKASVRKLASAPVDRAKVQELWTDVYQKLVCPIPATPTTDLERKRRDKAVRTLGDWARRFDRESHMVGANMWSAINVPSGWNQHDRTMRGDDKSERRFENSIIGDAGDFAAECVKMALARV
jgi:phage/plasmid-like protein (TIGR03299 family)